MVFSINSGNNMAARTQTTLRLDVELKAALEQIAEHRGRSLNSEIVQILKKEVDRFKKENPEHQFAVFK